MPSSTPAQAGYVFAAITLLIWSSFVVVSRLGTQGMLTPYDISALRIATAAAVLSPWWLPRLLDRSRRQLPGYQALIFALLAGISYPLVAYLGFRIAPASHGAMLISGMLPCFTSLLAWLLLGEAPNRQRLGGLLLILTGVITLLISGMPSLQAGLATWPGDLLLLTASLLWSLFTVLLKYWQARAFDVTLAVSAVSAIIYLPVFALFLPSHLAMAAWSEILLQAFFQGFVVVCVAMWTYARAVELLGSVRVVILMSGVPVAGVLLAVPVLGEPLTGGKLAGVILVCLGAALGAWAQGRSAALPSEGA